MLEEQSDSMADSMDTADVLGQAPASPAALEIVPGSPGVPRAPRSPEAASPAVREGSGLAEPPGIQLESKGRVRPSASAAERQAQRKRSLEAALHDEPCGSMSFMRPPSPGGSPPPLVLSPRDQRPVQFADLSAAVKREKKKTGVVGVRIERTFSVYLPAPEEVVAQEAVAQEQVDPETLFEASDLPALRSVQSSPKRQCRLHYGTKALSPVKDMNVDCDIKALSPLKRTNLDFDFTELQMYD
jgi:hypothetical protein